MARALISIGELDRLEGLVLQHLRTLRRLEQLQEQAAEYDTMPNDLGQLEEETRRLQRQLKALLGTWYERL